MVNGFDQALGTGMWRVVFYERRGNRVAMNRTAPWLTTKKLALSWANWFSERGHCVALQDQAGGLERVSVGLPG